MRDLDKNSINEVKSFAKPPEGVVFVMECVMVLLGKKTDWASIKSELGNVNAFLDSLLNFDVESVSEKVWKKARDGYISKPQFDYQTVLKISVAAASLCKWAGASSKYQMVTKKVAPKKAKLAEVTAILNEKQAELDIKMAMVKEVKDKVAALEA